MRAWLLRLGVPVLIVLAVVGLHRWAWRGDRAPLVVYCAHDEQYSRRIIADFQDRTGIRVDLRLDNELTKSLALTEQLIAERDHPRCDVFWNNELLGTADLADRGILEPYQGPGWRRIEGPFKDPEGRYCGFAARLRVYIVNSRMLSAEPAAIEQALAGELAQVTFACPLWGTTLTHYTVLWDLLGPDRLRAWRRDWLTRGAIEARSNGEVKDLVGSGRCALGLTDTDDYFLARDAGQPVAMQPVRLGDGKVICIPNTVALIRGTRRLEEARTLVDYLLSEEVELALAESPARQIPLGPVPDSALSDDVRQLRRWAQDAYDLSGLVKARRAVLTWLKSEILG